MTLIFEMTHVSRLTKWKLNTMFLLYAPIKACADLNATIHCIAMSTGT